MNEWDVKQEWDDPEIEQLQAEIERQHNRSKRAEKERDDANALLEERYYEIERLRSALSSVRRLIDEGVLVRDTNHDIARLVASIQEALGHE